MRLFRPLHLIIARQKAEIFGQVIINEYQGFLPLLVQKLLQAQSGSQRIAIRIDMCCNHKSLCLLQAMGRLVARNLYTQFSSSFFIFKSNSCICAL